MDFLRNIQKCVSIVLVVASLLLMYNYIANQHKHLAANGQYFVHAHPFSKNQDSSPIKEHHHSANELLFISLINNIFSNVLLIATFLFFVFLQLQRLLFATQTKSITNNSLFIANLRAPPSMG